MEKPTGLLRMVISDIATKSFCSLHHALPYASVIANILQLVDDNACPHLGHEANEFLDQSSSDRMQWPLTSSDYNKLCECPYERPQNRNVTHRHMLVDLRVYKHTCTEMCCLVHRWLNRFQRPYCFGQFQFRHTPAISTRDANWYVYFSVFVIGWQDVAFLSSTTSVCNWTPWRLHWTHPTIIMYRS